MSDPICPFMSIPVYSDMGHTGVVLFEQKCIMNRCMAWRVCADRHFRGTVIGGYCKLIEGRT